MAGCPSCGVPIDAGVFDESSVSDVPPPGGEIVLARYELHRNYCGQLLYFAQFTDRFARNPSEIQTLGYEWQIRRNGQPLDPYLTFDRIVNPWGLSGFPIHLRLEEGSSIELVVRRNQGIHDRLISRVGGRLLGRYWYDPGFGGAPNRL
jgi:hypothetical protein